jgi:ribosomal protein S7
MDTQLKKNKSTLSSYYFTPRYSRSKRRYFYRRKRYFYKKHLKLSIYEKKRFLVKLKSLYFIRNYSFFFSRNRIDAVRLKVYLYKFRRRFKGRLWRKKLKFGFKKFIFLFLKRKIRIRRFKHYKLLFLFYRKYNFYALLRHFVKYSRLKRILRKRRKVFRLRKKVYIVKKITSSRIGKLQTLVFFIQSLISRGKKKLSITLALKFYTLLKFKYNTEFLLKYFESIEKIRPLINYKTMYISGKKYKIPILMSTSKSYNVAIRWMIESSSEQNVSLKLFNNLVDTLRGEGALIKMRKDYHSLVFENKSYTRFLKFLKSGF